MPKTKKTAAPSGTAVAYARYSSAGQRDVSIDQQLQDIRAFAERQGYTLVHEYADHAKSGYHNTAARADFLCMLADAEKGLFSAVIVWKADRFGRRREDAVKYKAQLRRAGVDVLYAMEPLPTGAAGVLTEGMLESIAEWYSRNLAENVNRGMNDNARKCIHNGARIYGYHRGGDGRLAVTEQEAAVIRSVFARYVQGISSARIADELNAAGMKTLRGTPFRSQGILRFIADERYRGVYTWNGIRTPGGVPAIIDEQTWEAAQRMRAKTTKHYDQHPVDFLLTGKAFCGHCGASMVGDSGTSHTGSTHYYYTCQGHKARKGCHKRSLRKDALEDLVVRFVVDHCLTGPEREKIADAIIEAQKEQESRSPLAAMEAELANTVKKIDNINDAIEQGIWNSTTSVRLKSLEEAADDLRRTISKTKFAQAQLLTRDRILFFLDRMAAYDVADPGRRRQLIDTFVNAVFVYDDRIHIAINCIEGNATVPLSDLTFLDLPDPPPPSSDASASGVPFRNDRSELPDLSFFLSFAGRRSVGSSFGAGIGASSML